MKDFLEYNNYKGSCEYSVADKAYFGEVLGINDLLTYESETKEGLVKEFKLAIKDYLQGIEDLGKIL